VTHSVPRGRTEVGIARHAARIPALSTTVRRKLLFATLAVVTLLAAAEVGLRLAAIRARRAGRVVDADYVLLAVGDSFTHGVNLEPFESYPSRLEELLQAGAPSPDFRIRVVNEGEPGASAGRVLERLPALVDRYDPDGVLVLAGWNCSDFEFEAWEGREEGVIPAARRTLRSLRIYRALHHLLSRAATSDSQPVEPPAGSDAAAPRDTAGDGAAPRTRIFPLRHYDFREYQEINRTNLGSIAAWLRERGMRFALQTYPVKPPPRNTFTDRELYHWKKKFRLGREIDLPVLGREDYLFPERFDAGEIALNAVVREVATASGALLVDHALRFRDENEREVFLPGWTEEHPNARGYEIMAKEVFRVIREEGWLNLRATAARDD